MKTFFEARDLSLGIVMRLLRSLTSGRSLRNDRLNGLLYFGSRKLARLNGTCYRPPGTTLGWASSRSRLGFTSLHIPLG